MLKLLSILGIRCKDSTLKICIFAKLVKKILGLLILLLSSVNMLVSRTGEGLHGFRQIMVPD